MSVVLIVEDELLEQEFLQDLTQRELPKATVITCESGIQAVQLAKKHKPDLIFMDLMIPEMDGLHAIEKIRAFLPETPISILSACSDFSNAQKAIRLNVFDYILKPVKPHDFKSLLLKMSQTLKPVAAPTFHTSEVEVKESHKYIEEAIAFMKEHFKEKITLEMVASKVFMNPKYFSHVFKKEMGFSFTDYIIQLRIEYACKLLETTGYPAYRISTECGFSDPSYFNRVFCAQVNMTPNAYRKKRLQAV